MTKKPTKAAIERALLPIVRRGRSACYKNPSDPRSRVTWFRYGCGYLAVATDGRLWAAYLAEHLPDGLLDEHCETPVYRDRDLLYPARFSPDSAPASVSEVPFWLDLMADAWKVAAALDTLIRTPVQARRQGRGWLLRDTSNLPAAIVGDWSDVVAYDDYSRAAPRWVVLVCPLIAREGWGPVELGELYPVPS